MDALKKIQAQMKLLQKRADAIQAQSNDALEQIHKLMQKHRLTVADVERYVSKRGATRPVAKKATKGVYAVTRSFANPRTGETWSGRGRPPEWIRTAKNRDVFVVHGTHPQVSQGFERWTSSKTAAAKSVGKRAGGKKPVAAKKVAAKKAVHTKSVAQKSSTLSGAPGTGPGYSPHKKAHK
jgi:DNA-binding protein H-NS